MGPEPGVRNEPANVPGAVRSMAAARGVDPTEMTARIRENFHRLFGL
ncbi:MAG: TatD family hydrolase [Myxococcota bacterium]|nr:TatD family hydrolase [Myxococcota bacterium]